MQLKKKILIIILLITLFVGSYFFIVLDIHISYKDMPLQDKSTVNLFDDVSNYLDATNNAIINQTIISTGMYTDGNYKNFYAIMKIPPTDPYLLDAWKKGDASIAFESLLQGTKEWIINNRYKITMYYYPCEGSEPTVFFNKKWVGLDIRVSYKQLLPEESKGKSIYIRYESDLGSLLFMKNGNDIRFLDNYLTIQ